MISSGGSWQEQPISLSKKPFRTDLPRFILSIIRAEDVHGVVSFHRCREIKNTPELRKGLEESNEYPLYSLARQNVS
jgi:hypothetical protein